MRQSAVHDVSYLVLARVHRPGMRGAASAYSRLWARGGVATTGPQGARMLQGATTARCPAPGGFVDMSPIWSLKPGSKG